MTEMDGLQYTLIGGGSQEQGIGLEFLGLGAFGLWAMGVTWGFFSSSTPGFFWVLATFSRLFTTYISCRDGVFRQTWALQGFWELAFLVRTLVESSGGFSWLRFSKEGWMDGVYSTINGGLLMDSLQNFVSIVQIGKLLE